MGPSIETVIRTPWDARLAIGASCTQRLIGRVTARRRVVSRRAAVF